MTTKPTNVSFSGSIPEAYDTYLGPILFEFSAADIARRVANALSGAARVLEVACGTGISTRHLAAALPNGSEIVATDLNDAMLSHAAGVNGALPGVTYRQADALDLPFEDASFDAVVCQFGIMFFPDKAKGMNEMNRVLKPGGVVALNVWDSKDQNPAIGVADQIIQRFFPSDPPRFLEIPFGFHDRQEALALFRNAGFEGVEIAEVTEAVEVTDHSRAARGFVTGNPTIVEIEERASVSAEEVISATAQALERAFGPPPANISFREIVYVARKPAR